jgi:hypothetical protein
MAHIPATVRIGTQDEAADDDDDDDDDVDDDDTDDAGAPNLTSN